MRDGQNRFDKAIDSIEMFLEMDNSSSIVLKLYKNDKKRLEKMYPQLKFKLCGTEEIPRRRNNYQIIK